MHSPLPYVPLHSGLGHARFRRLELSWLLMLGFLAALLALTAALSKAEPSVAKAETSVTVCPSLQVRVISRNDEDARAACVGAARAIAFLGTRYYKVHRPITIHIVDTVNPIQGAAALGYFHAGDELLKVVARSALSVSARRNTVLGLPVNDDLYASVFTHEVTHAVFHQNVGEREPTLAAHEYFAYTVQLATLPESLRERVLAQFPGDGFNHLSQVGEIFLGLDPQRFAVKAYLHFRNAEDQEAVLRRLATLPSVLEMY